MVEPEFCIRGKRTKGERSKLNFGRGSSLTPRGILLTRGGPTVRTGGSKRQSRLGKRKSGEKSVCGVVGGERTGRRKAFPMDLGGESYIVKLKKQKVEGVRGRKRGRDEQTSLV